MAKALVLKDINAEYCAVAGIPPIVLSCKDSNIPILLGNYEQTAYICYCPYIQGGRFFR